MKVAPTSWNHGPFVEFRVKDCSERILSEEQKLWLGTKIVNNEATTNDFHDWYNIPTDTLRKYARIVRKGKIPHAAGGRPSLVNDAEAMKLKSKYKKDRKNEKATGLSKFEVYLAEAIAKTQETNGGNCTKNHDV